MCSRAFIMSSFTGTSVAAAGTPKDTGFSGSNGVAGSMDIQVTQSQTSASEAHGMPATELAPADSRATVASGGGAPVAAPADSLATVASGGGSAPVSAVASADSCATVASGGGSAPVAAVAPADSRRGRGRIVSCENSGNVYSGDYGDDEDEEEEGNEWWRELSLYSSDSSCRSCRW